MIRAKKRYGQNFLTDTNILEKIFRYAEISPEERVIEIGTGHGVLTRELDKRAASVISYEVDRDLFALNQKKLLPLLKNTTLIEADFLEIHLPWQEETSPYKIVANIPYNITTPIIEKLIEHRQYISSIFLMVQKEVADRLAAKAGTKDYGSFTIFVDYYCEVEKLFNVSRHCFRPSPNVDSAIIRITPRQAHPVNLNNEKLFFDLMHAAFWGRRKTIATALKKYPQTCQYASLVNTALQAVEINPQIRGEMLSIQRFADLANGLHALIQPTTKS